LLESSLQTLRHTLNKVSHPNAYEDLVAQEADKQKEKIAIAAKRSPSALKDSRQLTLSGCIEKAKPYGKNSPKAKSITRKLATFVAPSNIANRIVECSEFRELLLKLDPRYPIPSRVALDLQMESLYLELKGKIASKMEEARKVSMCTDIWSRKSLTQSFIGITVHFFTPSDHKRHVATLAVGVPPSPHTGDSIEEMVRTIISEWNISERKIRALITDNGSNMVSAFKNWLFEGTDDLGSENEDKDTVLQSPMFSCEESSDESISGCHNPQLGHKIDTPEARVTAIMKEVEEFDECEIECDVAFCGQKRIGCFAHSL
jgi:hypothetical protein